MRTEMKDAYRSSGVNRDAADRLVTKITGLTKNQAGLARVKSKIGGYASLYELTKENWLASSTDGVGTKLKLAFDWDSHHTVGIDLVAMSVNDLICVGATPLFFLDYFATGKLKPKTAERVLEGIVNGCRDAGCALVGGETAEMPGFYPNGEYDLAGFAVGNVHPKEVLPRDRGLGGVKPGDVILGLASHGFHSNGYSLVRKIFETWKPGKTQPTWAKSRKIVAQELLKPTRIYVRPLLPLIRENRIKGLAHITGSGFLNVPRISSDVSYEIHLPPLAMRARAYHWLHSAVKIPFSELAQTFNLGIGMVLVVSPSEKEQVLRRLRKSGELVWELGRVTKQKKGARCTVDIWDSTGARNEKESEHAVLRY